MIYSSSLSKKARLARGGGPQRERDSGLRRSSRSGHIIPIAARRFREKRPASMGGPSHLWEEAGPTRGGLGLIPVPECQFTQLKVVPKKNARRGRTEGPPDGVTAGLGTGDRWTEIIPFRWVNAERRSAFLNGQRAAAVSDSERPAGVGGLSGPFGTGICRTKAINRSRWVIQAAGCGFKESPPRAKRRAKLSEAGRAPGQGTLRAL